MAPSRVLALPLAYSRACREDHNMLSLVLLVIPPVGVQWLCFRSRPLGFTGFAVVPAHAVGIAHWRSMALRSVPPLGVQWFCFRSHPLESNYFAFGLAVWHSLIQFSAPPIGVQWVYFQSRPLVSAFWRDFSSPATRSSPSIKLPLCFLRKKRSH